MKYPVWSSGKQTPICPGAGLHYLAAACGTATGEAQRHGQLWDQAIRQSHLSASHVALQQLYPGFCHLDVYLRQLLVVAGVDTRRLTRHCPLLFPDSCLSCLQQDILHLSKRSIALLMILSSLLFLTSVIGPCHLTV